MLELVNKLNKVNYNLFLIIAIGSIPGTLIRWFIDNELIVNVFGSFLLGVLVGLAVSNRVQLLLGVGFSGSLTTFSGWIMSALQMIFVGDFLDAFLLIFKILGLGITSAALGLFIARNINRLKLFQ